MTTTPSGEWTRPTAPASVYHPLGRADGGEDCSTARLARLVEHPDRRVRRQGLVHLAERAGRATGEADAAGPAELLPREVPESPEEALLLAGIHERLGAHLPGLRTPPWRAAKLPVRVRIAWLRAELLMEPALLRSERPGEPLYQAVRSMDAADARRPDALVGELAGSQDAVLRGEAVRLIRLGLQGGLLAPGLARAHLSQVIGAESGGDAGDAAVRAALAELAEPWAAVDPLAEAAFAPHLDHARPVTRTTAALTAAARHGHGALLWPTAQDPAAPPVVRRLALELLGDLAGRGDIGALLGIAAPDPLMLGGPAVTCLKGLHRRGHFPQESHTAAVVALALADHSIEPEAVATILYTCRRAMLNLLVDAPADQPDWPRRLALLVALAAQGTGELPVGAAVTRLLPHARRPEPFLDAIRELRWEQAEEAVLALLPVAPEAALRTLEAIGGHRTVAALTRAFGTEPDGSGTATFLLPVRESALELLWRLNTDPDLRRHLLARVNPTAVPPAVAADLGAPDERELALLAALPEPADLVAALCAAAAHGSAATLPAVADLLLRITGELAEDWEADGTSAHGERGRTGEPAVPQEVVDAVRGLGARLHARRRIRPVCLLDASDAAEAGDALLSAMALDLLDRADMTARQQSILLEVLERTPSARTRSRVHRLLRHRDRHVRKRAIALLAVHADGQDARALSATLITLVRADDIQTVRQALLALGHARARWASSAIAERLGHPNMNIRKTAAAALVRAGTATAVPALLHALGRDENPGLRTELVAALRAVVGDAWVATLLAAAARCEDSRTRELVLRGLDGVLTVRTVRALADQGSPLVPTLCALVAHGSVRLGTGSAADLAGLSAERATGTPAAPAHSLDSDITLLHTHGWRDAVALRIAGGAEFPGPRQVRELRPLLAHWLGLAGSSPEAARGNVLRFVLRLCPGPWTDGELGHFAGGARLLTEGLAGPEEYRPEALAVLSAVASRLPAGERMDLADRVRTLTPAGHVPVLRLLKACDAVLLRADLDRALAAARLDADARGAGADVLCEVFGTPSPRTGDAHRAWTDGLADAARTPRGVQAFRARGDGPTGSRGRLSALMSVYPDVRDEAARTLLVDWMTDLQPLGVPPWTLGEAAPQGEEAVPTRDHASTRSAARYARLLESLGAAAPDRRAAAARHLVAWPEPGAARAVLDAYLRGRIPLTDGGRLAGCLATVDPAELDAEGIVPARVVRLAGLLGPWDLVPLIPLLLGQWEHGPAELRGAARDALRVAPPEVLAEHLRPRLATGAWGLLDLLAGLRLTASPGLRAIRDRLHAEGLTEETAGLLLDDEPVPHSRVPGPACEAPRQGRRDLLRLARTGGPEQIRRALSRLAEEHEGRAADPDPDLRQVLGELLTHPRPKVRLHAHRTSRTMLERREHLRLTAVLLADPQPDIRRMAVRTLARASWDPAAPAVVALLDDGNPAVRGEAADGLLLMGSAAVSALRYAAGRARPDRRARYTGVLDRLTAAES
ncbi:HEAT repeat domain-containing protein [Streptomyces sp. NPDC086010]|uniref:HEAT repeat domain-containing protein n=1 Tax=Streptomyces sp. NPDC086010 TaxID=3365745 RepID=UPI0037CF2C38